MVHSPPLSPPFFSPVITRESLSADIDITSLALLEATSKQKALSILRNPIKHLEAKLPTPLKSFLAQAPDSINVLDLSACEHLNADVMAYCFSRFKHLDCLILKSINCIPDDLFSTVPIHEKLTMVDFSSSLDLNDKLLQQLALSCPNLQDVGLKYCKGISNRGLKDLVKLCPQLIRLNLSHCTQIEQESLIDILSSLKNLKGLGLSFWRELTDYNLLSLAMEHPGLEDLELSNCLSITSEGLQEVLVTLNNLRSLDLSLDFTSVDQHVIEHLRYHSKLEYLDVMGCELDSISLQHLARSLSPLKCLILFGNKSVDNEFLHTLASKQVNLEYLTLTGCDQFDDNGLVNLAKGKSRSIKMLALYGNSLITDLSIYAIANNMKQLTHLELGGNDNITIDSLLYLVERIGSLRSLCVSNLKQLNQDDIRSLQKRNPHLRIIN